MKETIVTPEGIRERIWMELRRAALDRHHEWRTPALSTLGLDGRPDARTVVLRSADIVSSCLRFFTDARSQKIAQLAAQPQATLLFWSTRLNWQLRMRVNITTLTSGLEVQAVWERLKQSAASGDYTSALVPGQKCSTSDAAPASALQKHHLAILNASIEEIDWLELSREGHRRARLSACGFDWLVP